MNNTTFYSIITEKGTFLYGDVLKELWNLGSSFSVCIQSAKKEIKILTAYYLFNNKMYQVTQTFEYKLQKIENFDYYDADKGYQVVYDNYHYKQTFTDISVEVVNLNRFNNFKIN